MRLREMVWLGLAATGMLWPRLSSGQTIDERITVLEEKIKERTEAVAQMLPVDVHALVATDYQYSFNTPASHNVQLHVFDINAQSFLVNDAALWIQRQREDEAAGFVVDFDFGKTSQIVNGVSESTPSLREAYLTYKTPLTTPLTNKPITLKAGKFVTLLGEEVIKTYSNFNMNISNSIEFGFGIPYTHVGGLANVPVTDAVSFDLGVVNGWDDPTDNNSGLTFLGGVGITPADMLVIYISGTYGPEQPNRSGASNRGVVTANGTLKLNDSLSLVLAGMWGNETDIFLPASGKTGTAFWWDVTGYVVWQITQPLQFVLRPEVFDDQQGARTGFDPATGSAVLGGNQNAPRGAGTVWAITPTIAYQLTDHLLARAEYRYDQSSRPYFDRDSHVSNSSNVILFEGLFAF